MRGFYDWLIDGYANLGLMTRNGLGACLILISTAAALAIVVYLPPDHFKHSARDANWRRQHPGWRWVLRIGKNALGLAVLPLGIFEL